MDENKAESLDVMDMTMRDFCRLIRKAEVLFITRTPGGWMGTFGQTSGDEWRNDSRSLKELFEKLIRRLS